VADEPKVKIYSQEDSESRTDATPEPARRSAVNWVSIAIILILVVILVNAIW
jgi:hypothetical protein